MDLRLPKSSLLLYLLMSACARADALPGPLEYTAKKNGLYAVQDSAGTIVSEHITEREALQNAANYAITKKADYTVIHNYTASIVYKSDSVFLSFKWVPTLLRIDGSVMQSDDIAYHVIYGQSESGLDKLFEVTSATKLGAMVSGRYKRFSITAVDADGVESDKSEIVEIRK